MYVSEMNLHGNEDEGGTLAHASSLSTVKNHSKLLHSTAPSFPLGLQQSHTSQSSFTTFTQDNEIVVHPCFELGLYTVFSVAQIIRLVVE